MQPYRTPRPLFESPLGSGSLLAGSKTPVTFVLWATRVGAHNWGRIFDFGGSTAEYLFLAWTRGTTTSQDRIVCKDAVTSATNDSIAP